MGKIKLTPGTKTALLIVFAGLALAYVRHAITSGWQPWESYEQFFSYWFIHWLAIYLFMVPATFFISNLHEMFLGTKGKDVREMLPEFQYQLAMIILVGAAAIILLHYWPVTSDDY